MTNRKPTRKQTGTKLRREAAADEKLREKAKQALADALDGDDPKRRFEAAKSLYSFRAASSPKEQRDVIETGPRTIYGRRPTNLADVVRFALSIAEDGAVSPDLAYACRDVVAAAESALPGCGGVPFHVVRLGEPVERIDPATPTPSTTTERERRAGDPFSTRNS